MRIDVQAKVPIIERNGLDVAGTERDDITVRSDRNGRVLIVFEDTPDGSASVLVRAFDLIDAIKAATGGRS